MRFLLKVRRALATGGVRRLVYLATHRLERIPGRASGRPFAEAVSEFDARYGIDTSGCIDQVDLDTHDCRNWVHGAGYQPANADLLHTLAVASRISPETCTFVDLGCGKGRMVFSAIASGFKKAIGVEFSQTLMDCAISNRDAFQRRFAGDSDIEFYRCDAGEFQLPEGRLVLYLYNPFHGPVMKNVVERALDRCKASDEVMWIWYVNPQDARYWDGAGFQRTIELPESDTVIWSR